MGLALRSVLKPTNNGIYSITVTCDETCKGLEIHCSNGVNTYTAICPSVAPYEVVFSNLPSGTWTITGGTFSDEVYIPETFSLVLSSEFNWYSWCKSGNVPIKDYSNLEDVFADEKALRRLMLTHSSADYLINAVTHSVGVIDDFCNNDNAMKWIGLSDYVCDRLVAITSVEHKFLTSEYWKRYLKDHVPIMKSNTTPNGQASGSPIYYYSRDWYMAFCDTGIGFAGDQNVGAYVTYKFTKPIRVRRLVLEVRDWARQTKDFTLHGSNDNQTWTQIGGTYTTNFGSDNKSTFDIENDGYYQYYKVVTVSSYGGNSGFGNIGYYGRIQPNYSEKEFASGSQDKWLYDNGVELYPLDITSSVVKQKDCISLSLKDDTILSTMDVTNYNELHCIAGYDTYGSVDLLCGTESSTYTQQNIPDNTLDISNISGFDNVGLQQNADGVFDIRELWLSVGNNSNN